MFQSIIILVNVQCFFPQQMLNNNNNKKKYGERCVFFFKEKHALPDLFLMYTLCLRMSYYCKFYNYFNEIICVWEIVCGNQDIFGTS